MREQKVKSGETFSTVKYGDANLIPSFWPQEDWNWKNLTKHLSNVSNSSYTGPGNLQDFITKLILNCICALGEDPETFVDKNVDKKKLARRMKSHRIHEESHIIEDEANNANIEVEEMSQEGAYRAPCDPPPPESTSFVPRRKMPTGHPRSGLNLNENSVYPDLNSSEFGPLPPTATPEYDDRTPACDQSYTYMDNDVPYLSQIVPPILSEADYDQRLTHRDISDLPMFLTSIPETLHPGWAVENDGGGPCLFMSGGDHIGLKDFRHLRKFTHSHSEEQWYFFQPYYTFPLDVKIGTGSGFYLKPIPNAETFLEFLKSEESMMAWNTSQAEIVALGMIL